MLDKLRHADRKTLERLFLASIIGLGLSVPCLAASLGVFFKLTDSQIKPLNTQSINPEFGFVADIASNLGICEPEKGLYTSGGKYFIELIVGVNSKTLRSRSESHIIVKGCNVGP